MGIAEICYFRVGAFPNEPAIKRVVGTLMPEQKRRMGGYMMLETVFANCEDVNIVPVKFPAGEQFAPSL